MAKLTKKQRDALKAHQFAGPNRSYPIPDANHARLALAMSAGKSVEGQVRAAVQQKFPSIDQHVSQAAGAAKRKHRHKH